jgi:hypothetical protein
MSTPAPEGPLRPLELRRGTKAITELLAEGRKIGVPDDGRASDEIRRAARAQRFRWQLDVSGP